jgi:glutamate/tyrosine decarboxylase-like PLP-dependent enzyme
VTLPQTGEPAASVIDALARAGATGTVATQGPRYFGFVVGGSVPAATAADWLVSAWDQNAGCTCCRRSSRSSKRSRPGG